MGTSRRIKVVGGPCDGKIVELENGIRSVVLVPQYGSVLDFPGCLEGLKPAANRGVHYTARKIMYGGMMAVEYLAPADWDDGRAMRHQFEK